MTDNKVFAPIEGELIDICNVADPVFAEKMIGDGVAVRPLENKTYSVVSPCDGVVQIVHKSKHAVAVKNNDGLEVLVHVGIDTVSLNGEGFVECVKEGDVVKQGQEILKVDFALIHNKVPSTDVIVVVTNLTGQKLNKAEATKVEAGQVVFSIGADVEVSNSVEKGQEGEVLSDEVTIINKSGLHARPASFIFQTVNKFNSEVALIKNGEEFNAKSIVSILGMGARFKDKIKIKAQGADAQQVVKALTEAFRSGLGETAEHLDSSVSIQTNTETTIGDNHKLEGTQAAPGLVIGNSFVLEDSELSFPDDAQNSDEEERVLMENIEKVKKDIVSDIDKANSQAQKIKVEIFSAHLNLIDDPALLKEAKSHIKSGRSAPYSFDKAINSAINLLHDTGNKLLIERAADLKDINKRVIQSILGIEDKNSLEDLKNGIVVAKDLVPSDLSKFGEGVKGVILAGGSATSHASLMLRNMGVPTVVALGEQILGIKNDIPIILDADESIVTINPSKEILETIEVKRKELETVRAENLKHTKEDAVTLDGLKVVVKGNVSNSEEAQKAFDLGAEGIGLLRSEFLFFNSNQEPTVEDQLASYQGTVDAMQGGSVVIRTLDVGGDKPLSFVKIAHEENPIMGVRGVRSYKDNKEVFLNQIRAILQIKPLLLAKIMVPMISDVCEFKVIKEQILEEANKLGVKDKLQIGTMIEVPSAVLMADKLAKYADFFSIGTNDLAQYTMAMDRGNHKLTSRLKNLHPSVLKLIKMTVDAGNKNNITTSVCGAMASELEAIPILVGLGVHELSTSMRSIPDVKALVRTIDSQKCKEITEQALEMEDTQSVLDLVKNTFFNNK